jgi:PAS domain S-box-containing protein
MHWLNVQKLEHYKVAESPYDLGLKLPRIFIYILFGLVFYRFCHALLHILHRNIVETDISISVVHCINAIRRKHRFCVALALHEAEMLKNYTRLHITMNQEQLSKIRKVLKANPRGMTVSQISKEIDLNRNSVAKYLEVLLISGHVEMRSYGPAKVFFLSQRVPISAMLDFSSDYMLILDRDFRIIKVNDNFLKLVCMEREDLLGQRMEDVSLPVFDTAEIMSNLEAALKGEQIKREMECSVGEIDYCFNVKIVPTTFEDGLPGVTVILENITEHKRMEEELRKSEQHYRLLLESISDGVYVVDRDLRFVLVNDAGSDLLRMPKEKLLGKRISDLPQDVEETPFFKTLERVMETRKPDTVVSEYVYEDGWKGWYEVRMYPVPEGVLGIVRDITEQKQAEEELVRLSNAVKMSMDSIVITDLDAKIVDVNDVTLKMYGADDKSDLIGKNSFDLIVPEDREESSVLFKELLEKGYLKIQNFNVVNKDGDRRTIALSVGIMKDADGKPIGLVAISRDVPEGKKTE